MHCWRGGDAYRQRRLLASAADAVEGLIAAGISHAGPRSADELDRLAQAARLEEIPRLARLLTGAGFGSRSRRGRRLWMVRWCFSGSLSSKKLLRGRCSSTEERESNKTKEAERTTSCAVGSKEGWSQNPVSQPRPRNQALLPEWKWRSQ